MSSIKDRNHLLVCGYCRIESNDMNIIDGIIMMIFEYNKYATWSNEHKGKGIELFEDDTKAVCVSDAGNSIRADFCIEKGDIVSWELECRIIEQYCNFFGVISSEIIEFNTYPTDETMIGAWGLEDAKNWIYTGLGPVECIGWKKPLFRRQTVFVLKMTADWTEEQCKLTIFYNGKKLNNTNDEYTMLLPKLDNKYVWYPCVTPYNKDAYCIIRYAY